jgi:four helix bundle protein
LQRKFGRQSTVDGRRRGESSNVAASQVMPGSEFRRLVVYQRAAALANELHDAAVRWPNVELWSLGIQLIRSADSIAANIAEAEGRRQPADRRRLLLIARGSLYETEHWVLQAEARGLLPKGSATRLDEIARPLNGLVKRPV